MPGSLLHGLLDIAYPRQCAGCGEPVLDREGSHICWDCLAGMNTINAKYCEICGDPVDGMVEEKFTCSACNDHRPSFDFARSAVRHRGPVRQALHLYKYGAMTCLSSDFSEFMAACVTTHYEGMDFDAITFVPLYPRKERERTYNQAGLIASDLSRKLKLSCMPDCLRRIRDTPTQTDMSARKRQQNVRGAFVAANERWIEGRRLLLVDDVMTTGATVNECSRVLKKAGAFMVYVVTFARG